jgi:hypothetical protein
MDPRGFFLPLAEGERISGRWKARYRPPGGGSFPGELQVSDRRVFFVAQVESAQLQSLTVSPIDSISVAYACDLDTDQVTYERGLLRIAILKSEIERAIPTGQFFNHQVSLTIKNNGSIQLFDTGIIPVTGLVRVITT